MDPVSKSEKLTTTSRNISTSSRVRTHITVEESKRIKNDAEISWALRMTFVKFKIAEISWPDRMWIASRRHMETFIKLKD